MYSLKISTQTEASLENAWLQGNSRSLDSEAGSIAGSLRASLQMARQHPGHSKPLRVLD